MEIRFDFVAIVVGLSLAALVRADDNVREVQTKLSNDGFYFGEIDGAYSSDFSAALSRYQIREGLPITGQLDAETSKALGAKPAVSPSTAGTGESSETWRRLRKRERPAPTKRRETLSAGAGETATSSAPARSAPGATTSTSSESTQPASSAFAQATAGRSPSATGSADEFSADRLRDYVAAFVLAGLDKSVGAEAEFFADRVHYYDQGEMGREKIREDLKRYDERWPERHFWVAGKINVEAQSDNRVRVTFPLGFKLRNGNKQSSGKVEKTLVLEPAGDDLEIVAVNEHKTG